MADAPADSGSDKTEVTSNQIDTNLVDSSAGVDNKSEVTPDSSSEPEYSQASSRPPDPADSSTSNADTTVPFQAQESERGSVAFVQRSESNTLGVGTFSAQPGEADTDSAFNAQPATLLKVQQGVGTFSAQSSDSQSGIAQPGGGPFTSQMSHGIERSQVIGKSQPAIGPFSVQSSHESRVGVGPFSSHHSVGPRTSVLMPAAVFGRSGTGPPSALSGSMGTNPFAHQLSHRMPAAVTHTSGILAPSRLGAVNQPGIVQADSDTEEERRQRLSTPFLTPPRTDDPVLDGAVGGPRFQLKPSALTPHAERVKPTEADSDTPSSSILKPALLPDPTTKTDTSEVTGSNVLVPTSTEQSNGVTSERSEVSEAGGLNPTASLWTSSDEKENYFVGALQNSNGSQNGAVGQPTSTSEFVFGQNISERVVVTDASAVVSPAITTTSRAEFLFGQNLADRAVKSDSSPEKDQDREPDSTEASSPTGKSLEESAREYQARHDLRPELKEVEVKTGEEEESNVLQANCRLFLFDASNQSWIEKGRGILRLNDMSERHSLYFQSRVVMRTHGSLRVILNTKIWAGMTVDRASSKSIRLTATGVDSEEGVKVFLIMAGPKDTENILRAIDGRIQQLRLLEEKQKDSRGVEKRKAETDESEAALKKQRQCPDDTQPTELKRNSKEESNDSSVGDPETEASSESFASSQTVRSESD